MCCGASSAATSRVRSLPQLASKPVQPLGVLLLSCGSWIVYCGYHGLDVVDLTMAVLTDPGNASQIVGDAVAMKAEYQAPSIGAGKGMDLGGAIGTGTPTAPGSVLNGIGLGAIAAFWDLFPVTSTDAQHKARKSLGGTDYGMPVGTPIVTPFGGSVNNIAGSGSGGYMVTVTRTDGYRIEFLHMSKFAKSSGDVVGAGTVVGYSGGAKGAVGAGSSTGPHLHVHVITPQGNRITWEAFKKL